MVTHRVKWWVYVDGERVRHTSNMRGTWNYDATCSCGFDSQTGGGLYSYVAEKIQAHRQDPVWALAAKEVSMNDDELREAEMYGDGVTDEVSPASYARQQDPSWPPVGARVTLVRCTDEHTRLDPGSLGTVRLVDGMGTVHVDWDSGSTLGLVYEAGDRFQVVS
jgi:hypothetical protein